MTSIKLTVIGAHAWASVNGPLTSGMVGIPVTIEYDKAWDGLTKNLMCRCSPWGSIEGENRAILNVGETAAVAHEVMLADMYLYLGVEGFNDDGTLVIPTTWACCGKIAYGANTGEDPSTDPSLSVWNQLQIEMEQTKEYVLTPEQAVNIQAYAREARQAAEEAKQTAENGLYYTPVVTQPTDNTLKFEFQPSVIGAPSPNPVTVELPIGEDSGQNPTDGENGFSPIATVTQTDTGAVISITDVNGTTTATITNGKDGTPGADGYTPAKGVDYYTDADKAEFSQYIASELAKRGQLRPEFANDVSECTDTTKLYVLPDGYIYAYMQKTQTITHNANDGTGVLNARPKSNSALDGGYSTQSGLFTTSAIEVDNTWGNCFVTVDGLEKIVPTWYSSMFAFYYQADGTWLGYDTNDVLGFPPADEEHTLPKTVDLSKSSFWANTGHVRIAVGITMGTQITEADVESLVINFDKLDRTETVSGWHSTGHMFNTDDYGQAIEQNAANIEALQADVAALQEAQKNLPSQSGAVWYAVGDSITKGYGVGAENCWVTHVLKYNGYDSEKSRNLGISGLGFAKTDPNYGKTARNVVDENDFSQVDLVTIAIGINDWKEPFSMDTVKSEMGYCFEKILTDNPYCKIIFITPFNMCNKGSESTNWALGYSGSDVTGGTLADFVNAQKSVCAQYGIQVIDMTTTSVINKKNITAVLSDGIHPDTACHKALGRELSRRIAFA